MTDSLVRLETYSKFRDQFYSMEPSFIPGEKLFIKEIDAPMKEFTDVLGIIKQITRNSDGTTSSRYTFAADTNNSPILVAVITFLNEQSNAHQRFHELASLTGRPNEINDTEVKLITINRAVLREMAISNATQEEIAGRFIVDIQSGYPELVKQMNASSALVFANGVSAFSRDVQKEAEQEIVKADERTREKAAAVGTEVTFKGVAEAITYWDTKYKNHRNAKLMSLVTFVLVLGAGIVIVFFGESLLPGVPGGENGDAGYKWAHYLRVVIFPTLAVAWLLRLISRQFITHLLLQEDARLRQTLVRTFLSLQRNPDADIADKERAHMLEAIFRPLPVTPNGDVNQPSFADIAKVAK